ncbi:MAG: proton-conducting transporter membrane subunit [Bryobacteraceae bacterium]
MPELSLPFLTVTVLAPALGAFGVLRTKSASMARAIAAAAVGCSLLASCAALWEVTERGGGSLAEPWSLPSLGSAHPWFAADALNALALVVFAALALLTVLVAPRRDIGRPLLAQTLLLVSATQTVYATEHLLLLVVAWTLASLPLLIAKHPAVNGAAQSRAAALPRIALGSSTAALAGAVALIVNDAAAAGVTAPFSLSALKDGSSPGGTWAFALLMAAVLLGKGIFPMHSWVVSAFDRGPLLTASLLVNGHLGAFLVARVAIPVLPDVALRALPFLSDVALFTVLYTAVLALCEREPRRLFGLLLVGQASSILVGLESATEPGVTGALVHWIVVAASTTCLAAVYRLVETRVGGRITGDRFLGLAGSFPRLAVFFLVSGLALIGLPGTLGFCAEDLLIHGTLESHPQLGVALPIATALFAFHIFRLFAILFLGKRPSGLFGVPDALPRERFCLAAIVVFLVVTGVAPAWIVSQRAQAAGALVDNLRRANVASHPARTPQAPSLTP